MANNDLSSYHNLFIEKATDCLQIMKDKLAVLNSSSDQQIKFEAISELHRMAHTLKGQCAFMGYSITAHYCLLLEKIFLVLKEKTILPLVDQMTILSSAGVNLTSALTTIAQTHQEPDLKNKQVSLEQFLLTL
jgi:chemotaxis protein histidine kinase CheA